MHIVYLARIATEMVHVKATEHERAMENVPVMPATRAKHVTSVQFSISNHIEMRRNYYVAHVTQLVNRTRAALELDRKVGSIETVIYFEFD